MGRSRVDGSEEGFAFFFGQPAGAAPRTDGPLRRDFAERLTAMCGVMIACGRFPAGRGRTLPVA